MSETVVVGLLAASAGLAGVVLSAVIDELRLRRRDERLRESEQRDRHLEAIRQTRLMLAAQVAWLQDVAVGDIQAAAESKGRLETQERGSLGLVGDIEVARAYQELVVRLQRRFGQSIRVEDVIDVVNVMGLVTDALDQQEQRILGGTEIRQLTTAELQRLADPEDLADRMLAVDRYPSIAARIARLVILPLSWVTRRRRRVHRSANASDPKVWPLAQIPDPERDQTAESGPLSDAARDEPTPSPARGRNRRS